MNVPIPASGIRESMLRPTDPMTLWQSRPGRSEA
jgi:hypothetical protein